jgi:catechol 1,2-dioxygenase
MQKEQIKQLVDRITSTQIKEPNPRVKAIVDRLLLDFFVVIDDFDIQPEEFWSALSYLTELGQRNEQGCSVLVCEWTGSRKASPDEG